MSDYKPDEQEMKIKILETRLKVVEALYLEQKKDFKMVEKLLYKITASDCSCLPYDEIKICMSFLISRC